MTPRPLLAPATVSLAGGATFIAPAGWTVQLDEGGARLDGPEPGLAVLLTTARDDDADSAVRFTWATLLPGDTTPPDAVSAASPHNGWREARHYVYQLPPNQRRVRLARAHRGDAGWTVVAVAASSDAMERRLADVQRLLASLRAPGWRPESFAGRRAHRFDEGRLAALTGFIDEARQRAGVPGVALALVEGSQVRFAGGFGRCALGRAEAVDADTRFLIASNTKALTTLLLARLCDEGRLRWDAPVTSLYPSFRLGSEATTAQVQLRHLVGAATGMPRRDLDWLFDFARRTPDDQLARLADMQPTTAFGEVFQYNNLLAAAAGFIAGSVLDPHAELGAAYDAAMQSRVFAPLGMRSATFDFATAQAGNHAAPHAWDVDGAMATAALDLDHAIVSLRPAGGAWASARDLARYLQLELAGGRLPDGQRYVRAATLAERRRPQVNISEGETYGMGLISSSRWELPLVHHGGFLFGYTSDLFWLPEHGVGGVLLTNANEGRLLLAPFLRRAVELLFDGHPEAEADFAAALEAARVELRQERARLQLPPDAEASSALAVRYRAAELGSLTVRRDGAGVVFDFGEWRSPVGARRHADGSLSFVTTAPATAGFELVVGARAGRRTLVIRDAQHEYEFVETED